MHLLCLPALVFVFWIENSSAVCILKVYSTNAKCEEALANDAKSYPACSTLDFSTQVLICELRSRADLDALRSGRRALPGLPVSIEWRLEPMKYYKVPRSVYQFRGRAVSANGRIRYICDFPSKIFDRSHISWDNR